MEKIAVLGCGAWATTFASLCAENGHEVLIWCHRSEIAEAINQTHEQPFALPGYQLSPSLKAVTTFDELEASHILVLGLASKYLDHVSNGLSKLAHFQKIWILTKGLVIQETPVLVSDWVSSLWPKAVDVAVVSGPNLAKEVLAKQPAAVVVASKNDAFAKQSQAAISSPFFRAYTSTDLVGVSLGGILKNAYAIGAGIIDALELGANAKAAFLTRALPEMVRLTKAMGGQMQTLYGLSGLGDLMTTCFSSLSRNYSYGYHFVKPESLPYTFAASAVPEGVKTLENVRHISNLYHVEMPILEELYEIIHNQKSAKNSISDLFSRELKSE